MKRSFQVSSFKFRVSSDRMTLIDVINELDK
jgi:hypothetical protein